MTELSQQLTLTECPKCKSLSSEGKKYCGDCGTPLDAFGPIKDYLDANLRSQILNVLKEQFKDLKILESEIAEGIATRRSGWAQLLAFFIGIPLGILILTLAAVGIKNYLDFTNMVGIAQKETGDRVQAALKDVESITEQSQSLKDELTQASGLANDVKVLSLKVNAISEQINFLPTAALTPELKASLESTLAQFQKNMQGRVPRLGRRGSNCRKLSEG